MISRRVGRLSVRRVAKLGGISIAHWSSRICATTSLRAWSASTKTSGSVSRGFWVTVDQISEACDGSPTVSSTGIENTGEMMATVQVRYIVNDVDAAIAFYCQHLGFREEMHPAPSFAMLSRGDLRLVLSQPGRGPGGGGQAMPDGTLPEPGGWNRFTIEVSDLAATAERLRQAGVHFRNDIVTGVGGKQILIDDTSGNPVELFEPIIDEARLSSTS